MTAIKTLKLITLFGLMCVCFARAGITHADAIQLNATIDNTGTITDVSAFTVCKVPISSDTRYTDKLDLS